MSRRVALKIVMGGLLLGIPHALGAQATATANIRAEVVSAISIAKTVDLDFGILSVGATGGTVVLTPTAGGGCNISQTGDVDQGSSSSSVATCAEFQVTGATDAFYSVTLPASATITSGANSMTVDNFQACSMTAASCTFFSLDGSGTDNLIVGATLNVNGGQAQGVYTGTFDVTVEYTP